MNNLNIKKYLPFLLIMLSVILLLGTSYALLRSSQVGENPYVMNVGLLEVTFQDANTNALTLENMFPMTDTEGMEIDKELEFTVKNTGTLPAKYNIYIEETSTSPEFKSVIRFISNKNNTAYNNPKTLSDNNFIEQFATLDVGESATYKVKVWLAEEADSTYMNKTFTARVVVDVIQGNIPSSEEFKRKIMTTRPNSYIEDADGTIYISGKKDDYNKETTDDIDFNYVWYSGKLWRITAIYSDGTMKMITEDLITSIAWGASSTVSDSDTTSAYSTSWVREWLNQEFLPNLYDYENIIVTDYKWNATTSTSYATKTPEITMITDLVGMLNVYEYFLSYQKARDIRYGFLNIGYFWWSITPYNSSNVYAVSQSHGGCDYRSNNNTEGIRPVVVLKTSIQLVDGDGTYDNPYKIKGAQESATANVSLLNTRQSGEYVKIINDTIKDRTFRIVGIENGTTKLVLNDYLKENGIVITKKFPSNYMYGFDMNTSDLYCDYYLNNTYLATLDINLLEQGTYYLGKNIYATSYKTTVCKNVSSDISINDCIENNTIENPTIVENIWTGYIGLLRTGEMFSSQINNYTTSNANTYWLISSRDDNYISTIYNHGEVIGLSSNSNIAMRPTIHLKSEIVIKSGSGTEQDPFVVGLPS